MAIDPSATIHPSALVEDGAEIGPGATVGPFSVIGPKVRLGPGVVVKSHAVVTGLTEIGEGTVIFPFANIGDIPQDLKYRGEETRLIVGKRNRIREAVTMNTGTEGGGGITRVGDDCLFMTGSHVGHDVQVGNGVIVANHAAFAGHCIIGDNVVIGGLAGIHQWVRIGQGAIIGALTMVTNDVIPFGLVQGPRGVLDGLNLVGLKRRGVAREDIAALRAAFQHLAEGEGTFHERARHLAETADSAYVRQMVEFVLADTDRSFLTPKP
ncbi:acyl-ACP--UDP-N-acetylglucosamine O-acyltransferase [Rhodovulum kholense]|uniref:Acyl-[acyl-carrier-protein]--UDP-N-acetylglucosamine O-acyltransferase n=1 Tax=Rhodovulum kholense TaxID=453584 RepID=A0A8E2VPU5_9RHOB|nr:acyl-ACP--UDP-N-acetylglucosamine O-acyltransferase [Rhodovulum kholense]PTW51894.1 acyl-[acyl-carrier-protein]--UDP-N-acetylglucosamine O-acyltransferase [Rhodovulum kholense]